MTNKTKHSIGPKTDEGKAISSRNSVTHGLTARRWLNINEQSLYDETVKNLIVDFEPQSSIENILISKMAECTVRLMRTQKVENAMFDLASSEANSLLEAVKSLDNNSDRLIPAVQDTISIAWKFDLSSYTTKMQMLIEINEQKFDRISDWSYVEKNMPVNTDYICKASVATNLIIKDFIAREANQSYFIDVRVSFLGCDESKKDDSLTIDEIFKDSHEVSSTSLQKYFKNLKVRIINDLQVQTVLRGSTERSQLLQDAAMPDTQKLHLVQRYRTADERQFSKTLGELLELQKRRKESN
jgi:hypothetical protein